ncbi:MAG: ATP-NAD kinase family protein [Methylobacteriaceae bacterium]|nr:ATP-NAD kinase family protein [Methylobacteriaceae bacterium]MBV9703544.1 ATP-NAD kinase family protein [Methylobacteriaceae bacterium]
MPERLELGLIVNPIAGMGGAVGLKGSDSPEILRQARALGAVAPAPQRALGALQVIAAALGDRIEVVAASGDMGERVARAAGLAVTAIAGGYAEASTPVDTQRAATEMASRGVRVLLLAGGDGTARDLCRAIGETVPVIGIPAGVKMHSAVYATTPRAAGELAARFLDGGLPLRTREVMDIDEEAYRAGDLTARLFGFLSIPFHRDLVQGMKAGRANSDAAALEEIAAEVADRLEPDRLYVVGPGTTTRAILRRLGLPKTLLGVDLICDRKVVAADVSESVLLDAARGRRVSVIVTPIGGQGHFLGRGNQQISPAVLRQAGRGGITIVATPEKLASLAAQPLRVDTGDRELDQALSGYVRVITGYRTEAVCRVTA